MKQTIRQITMTTFFTLCAVFAMTAAAAAATFVVDTTADNGTLTACTAAANDCSLRGAIANANNAPSNDTITFAIPATDAGCVSGLCTITLATQLAVLGFTPTLPNPGTLSIDNSTGANRIAVSGNNATRVFNINSGANATLTNIAVINGNAGNSTGGGIFVAGTLTLNNSTVSGNSGFSGGGFFINGGGTLTLNNSTVSGNTATNRRSTGGGGGIDNFNGTLNVVNSTVAFNSSTNTGCTDCAGGIFNNGTTTLTNSIVAKNTVANTFSFPDVRGTLAAASSFNLIGDGKGSSGITNGTNGNQIGTTASPIDPLLAPLADNGGQTRTHALQTNSPAIDQGNGTGTDQRGMTRPVDNPAIPNAAGGNGADIGAFEVQAPTAAGVSISGRVFAGKGRGLVNATVYLTDSRGETRAARTSTFGYYRFDDLAAGQTVIMTVISKRYSFAPRVVSLTDNALGEDFIAEQ